VRGLAWLLCLAAGCGRVGFDAAGCVGIDPHDEDGDGRPDGCDLCPHLADPAQADADGDGVGDACDREPGLPRQTILLFDPFLAPHPEVEPSSAWVFAGDSIFGTAATVASLFLTTATAADQVYVVGRIVTPSTTDVNQLSVHYTAGPQVVYCELYDPPDELLSLSLTRFDDGYQRIMDSFFPGDLVPGPFFLDASMDAPSSTGACEGGQSRPPARVSGSIPFTGNDVSFDVQNVELHVDSLTVIRSL
jgi:hypothetical protein